MRVLYLTYDGLTDPLGQSQILPYLAKLSALGHEIDLISCEKPERSEAERREVAGLCRSAGIRWHPLPYHARPPVLSTLRDLVAMARLASRLHRERRFELVHCRSYLTALVAQRLRRRFGTPFLFDMRGFWPDERVEGGLWDLANPLYRTIFHWFKARESEFLREAAHVVTLTEASREQLMQRPDGPAPDRITLIPCCVDVEDFPAITPERRAGARQSLGIPEDERVAVYLGSIGTWYMLGEMLDFFAMQLAREPRATMLFITRDRPEEIIALAGQRGLAADRLIVRAAGRREVHQLLAAADYGLFFIRPVFSKLASSPTKLGELMAVGLPVVTNSGVGDVDRIIVEAAAGVLVERFDAEAYGAALDSLDRLTLEPERLRGAILRWFDLDQGVARYDAIYRGVAASDRNSSTSRGA